jgi:hypothetical protein
MTNVVFNTAGNGLWSSEERAVRITDMKIGYIDDELDGNGRCTFGELRVKFDRKTWDINKHGLIYTDRQFLRELREFLDSQGLVGKDVDYSEQGMQGDDYVSLDVGEKFLASWAEKFGIVWADVVKEQQAAFEKRWMA